MAVASQGKTVKPAAYESNNALFETATRPGWALRSLPEPSKRSMAIEEGRVTYPLGPASSTTPAVAEHEEAQILAHADVVAAFAGSMDEFEAWEQSL